MPLYRYRVARLLEMANMRTRIATDLHDDIGANLDADRAAQRSRAKAAARRQDGPLASIARISRESVSSMSDIVWAINPKRESLLDLTRRMRQHADEVFTPRGIELPFTAPGRRRHAEAGRGRPAGPAADLQGGGQQCRAPLPHARAWTSTCASKDARLLLTVADNGVGFDPSNESEGQGLTSMQRRAQRLDGTLDIRIDDRSGNHGQTRASRPDSSIALPPEPHVNT